MAIPTAAFTFTDSLDRTVTFKDGSSGSPTSWSWDFGDSSSSTDQNPAAHVYAADGVYKVKLTSTNVDGSTSFEYEIVVVNGMLVIGSIAQLVKDELPTGVTISDMAIQNAMRNWMVIMKDADKLEDADQFNQAKYRPVTRLLIARLIIYEKIVQQAQGGLVQMGGSNAGGLKAVEIGPARTEWYNESESWKSALQTGGSVELLTSSLCGLAGEVGIHLPMCRKTKHVLLPKVYYPCRR